MRLAIGMRTSILCLSPQPHPHPFFCNSILTHYTESRFRLPQTGSGVTPQRCPYYSNSFKASKNSSSSHRIGGFAAVTS